MGPAFRRRGLGRLLSEASLVWMREAGAAVAVSLSWRSGRDGSSAALFRALGFAEGRTVEEFYYAESVRDGWTCPVCAGPCRCAATFYVLRLR